MTSGGPQTTPRSRLPRAEREQQMLDVAHAQFAERGYGAVTMDDVAAAVGVTKPLLYNYFGNKERLYLACLERSAESMLTTVMDAVARTSTPDDALAAAVRAFFAFVDADRAAWAVLFDETLPAVGEIADAVRNYRERLTGLIIGSLRPQVAQSRRARIELEALSEALLGAAEALARWWLRTDAMPAADAAELFITTVQPGVRARAAAGHTDTNQGPS